MWKAFAVLGLVLIAGAAIEQAPSVGPQLYWSSGLSHYLAATTKSQLYPCRKELGSILESVRLDLMKDAILSQTFPHDNSIENRDQSIVCDSHDSPPPSIATLYRHSLSPPSIATLYRHPQSPPSIATLYRHPLSPPSISLFEHNSKDEKRTPPHPPPPTQPLQQLVPDVLHYINLDEDENELHSEIT